MTKTFPPKIVHALVSILLLLTFSSHAYEPGTVVAWGFNDYSQLDVPRGLSNVIAIASGDDHGMALKDDGTVATWGKPWTGVSVAVPEGLSNVVAIAAGRFHCLALKNDGTVVAWGGNAWGESDVPFGLTNVIAIAGGYAHSLALKADGTVIGWGGDGNGDFGEAIPPAGLRNVIAIAAGEDHSVALRRDGKLFFWGYNGYGEDSPPANATNLVAIASGAHHVLALNKDGKLFSWGRNEESEVSAQPHTSAAAIAAGYAHSLAIRTNGTVVTWAQEYSPMPDGLTNVIAVAGGDTHSFALIGKKYRAGSYHGFLNQADRPDADTSGYFSIITASDRSFTVDVFVAGVSYTATGKFGLDGNALVSIPRPNQRPLTLTLKFDVVYQRETVTGLVSDGDWMATLLGDRNTFNKTNPAPQMGTYSLTLWTDSNGDSSPGVGSYGRITVDASGKVTLHGLLSDNSVISQSTGLSQNGQWPLYVNLYKGRGKLMGWVTFTNQPTFKLVGNISWIKKKAYGPYYHNGFTNILPLVGSSLRP